MWALSPSLWPWPTNRKIYCQKLAPEGLYHTISCLSLYSPGAHKILNWIPKIMVQFSTLSLSPSLPSLAFYSHSVRTTAFFFTELVKIIASSLIMKCDITFLLVHSVKSYPCFASYRYPQKHGRKKNYFAQKFCINDWSFQFHSASQRHIFFLSRFIGQSQCSMTRMLIVVPRPSLMLIPVTGLLNESLFR